MKPSAIAIAICIAGMAGVAFAAQPGGATSGVQRSTSSFSGCEPPNDHAGRACDEFNRLIHANFSQREIGMLFGNRTSYPESLTGGVDRVQRRYQAVVQEYLAARRMADGARIAEK